VQRRKYVTLTGSALLTSLAGCTGDSSSSGNNGSGQGNGSTQSESTAETNQTNASTGSSPGNQTSTTEETAQNETTEQEATEENTTEETSQGAGFGPRTFEGSGTETSDEITLSTGPLTAEFSHDGDSNFITDLITLEGESYQDVSLTNFIGTAEGSTVATVSASGGHKLNVDADGEWSITLEQDPGVSPESLPVDASGQGRTYVGPYEFSGATEFQGTHDGSSNFIVSPVPVDPSAMATSIFNKIGEFEGSTTSRLDGVFFLDIQADGKWTLSTA
jgi:hypothetical protein